MAGSLLQHHQKVQGFSRLLKCSGKLYPYPVSLDSNRRTQWNGYTIHSQPLTLQRTYHTSNSNGGPQGRRRVNGPGGSHKVTLVARPLGPLAYLSKIFKMFWLRTSFDSNFVENEFLNGAKQAVCHVSMRISQDRINDLGEVLTLNGIQSSRKLYEKYQSNPGRLHIDMEDITAIVLDDIHFDYEEPDEKYVIIYVDVFCTSSSDTPQTLKVGDMEIELPIPTKKLSYSFRRDYTPGRSDAGWLVDHIKQLDIFPRKMETK